MVTSEKSDTVAVPRAQPSRSMLRFVPSLYVVAVFAVLAAIFIIALAPRADTDFWWHLKVGGYIAAHHVVPSRDYISYTFVGRPWTDHEWLSEITLYGLYAAGGMWALLFLFAGIITATWALVYLRILRMGVNRVLGLFIVVPAFFASTASWGVRIQMVSLLFVAIFMLLLDRYRETGDRRLLFAFPILMVLWTNLHGGFVLGLVVMGVTLAGEILNLGTKREWAIKATVLRPLFYAFCATFAVTILNPNGVRQLLYPLTFVLPNAFTNQIQESASPDFHMPVMMVFEALILLMIAAIFWTRPRIDWVQLLMIVAFTHLAFSQVRNVPLWGVVVAPYIALYLQRGKPPRVRKPLTARIVPILNVAFLVAILAIYGTMVARYITPKALAQSQRNAFPTRAVAYMKHHQLPPHVFVSYSWAGYMIWNLFPRYRDFMDSRADTLYTPKMLNAYEDAYDGTARWKTVLRQYHVQDVLVERDAPLAQLLALTPGWRLAYHDDQAVLYTRGT